MSAFERTLKQHLVSYRIIRATFIYHQVVEKNKLLVARLLSRIYIALNGTQISPALEGAVLRGTYSNRLQSIGTMQMLVCGGDAAFCQITVDCC